MSEGGDFDRLLLEFEELFAGGPRPSSIDPDLVADLSRSRRPDAGVYRGLDEAVGLFDSMRDAVQDLRWNGRIVDRPNAATAVLETTLSARGRSSGIVGEGHGAMVWKVRDGRLAETVLFQDVGEARAHVVRMGKAEQVAAARLYFVCEARPAGRDPRPLLDAVIRGGAGIVQLREKALGDEELVAAARPFREAAAVGGALFMLNDRPDLVAECGADGVHVGQDDMPVAEARRIAGEAALIGLSTHTEPQVDAVGRAIGVARPDQVSVGPVWETPTKQGRPATGIGLIEHASRQEDLPPWFAIGGIDSESVREVAAAGASRAVVVRAIRDAEDPESAARAIDDALSARERETADSDG